MTRFYDIDAANAAVPELDGILRVLAEQRAELVRLRDEVLARGSGGGDGAPTAIAERPSRRSDGARPVDDLRLTRLRMQGLIDQMAAGVARIDALGLTLRDIEHGLVDFPALVAGRQVWLCWQRGETSIGFWHSLDSGFSAGGRWPSWHDRALAVVVGRGRAGKGVPAAPRGRTVGGPRGRPGGLRARRLLRGPRAAGAGLDGHAPTSPSGPCCRA